MHQMMDGFLSSSGVEPAAQSSTPSPSFRETAAYQKFMSAPACLVPPGKVEAVAAAAAAEGSSSSSSSSRSNSSRTGSNGGAGDGGQLPETCSIADVPGASSPRSLQEQKPGELLEAAAATTAAVTDVSPPPHPNTGGLPEGDDKVPVRAEQEQDQQQRCKLSPVVDGTPPSTTGEVDLCVDKKSEQDAVHAWRGSAGDDGGGEAGSRVAAPSERAPHPVLELYRAIPEPLDPASFEELKRRISSLEDKDGVEPAPSAGLVDFLGVLKRASSEDRPEGTKRSNTTSTSSSGLSHDGAGKAAEEGAPDAEAAALAGEGVCDAMEGVEQGGGGGDAEAAEQQCCDAAAGPPVSAAPSAPGSLSQIILKFTTVADGNDASSFTIERAHGATVGRGACNDISIPNDSCMGESDHASIVWRDGAFHVEDKGHPYGASVRIGTGRGLRDWPLDQGSMFSAGNSVFHTTEIDEEAGMLLEIVAGPLKGESRRIHRDGASVGRATDSTISIADRELSRNHSIIECDDTRSRDTSRSSLAASRGGGREMSSVSGSDGGAAGRESDANEQSDCELSRDHSTANLDSTAGRGRSEYYLCDVGSTNGTYVQLVGPYASSRRLELSDHILIGRTGFSINRFDWGVWEDRGARRTMEDKSVVIQDMGVESLTSLGLGPQTFLAVYDGHGGAEASAFLWQRLHVAIAEALEDATLRISSALQQDRVAERLAVFGSGGGGEAMRCDDRDETESGKVRGGGRSPGVFSSNSGGGSALMPPLPPPPPPPAEAARPALAVTATEPDGADAEEDQEEAQASRGGWREVGVKSDDPRMARTRSGENSAGGRESKGLWWGYDPSAGARAGGSGPRREAPPLPTAPSLPVEWLFGAREMVNTVRSGGAAATSASAGMEPHESAPDSSPRHGGGSDGVDVGEGLPACGDGSACRGGDGSPAAGGDAARGVCTEADGGGEQGGGGGEAVEEEEVAGKGSGLASPPLLAGMGRQSGVQSPGGGPSRPLPTAGLPAEGGGGGFAHEGGAVPERQKAPTAVDRVIEEVVGRAFLATDEEFLTTANKPSSGSTATTAMIIGDRFYSFNVGDSRTILSRGGRAEVVSKDHKPSRDDETDRIKRAGGMVIHKRVMGELAVSRAFGDRTFKIGIKAILREEDEHQQYLAHDDDADMSDDDDEDEDDGLNHAAPASASVDGSEEAIEPSTADHNSLTMGRGSSLGSGKLLPPPAVAPPAPPAASPPAPTAAPSPPVAMAARKREVKPVTDPDGALITAEPEMLTCRITPEDEFILLACDGLFDVFSSDEVVKIVRKELRRHGDTQRVCETLTRKAIDERYTQDNVSVVLVVLKKFW